MTLCALSFAVLVVSVRELSAKFPTIEIVFVRAVVGVFLILPVVARSGIRTLKTTRLPLHGVRTVFALIAMVTFYYAIGEMAAADAQAISFLIPVFTTIAAALVLRERVDVARWAAVAAGFAGALVIIQPLAASAWLPVAMAVVSTVAYAGAWTTIKFLTRTESASVTVFYMNVLMLPLTLIPTLFVWVTPGAEDILPLAAMALSGWAAHFCQARAFAAADASAVMPFDFLRLPFTAMLAWFLFMEGLGPTTIIGAVIVFGATYFITWHEARMARRERSDG